MKDDVKIGGEGQTIGEMIERGRDGWVDRTDFENGMMRKTSKNVNTLISAKEGQFYIASAFCAESFIYITYSIMLGYTTQIIHPQNHLNPVCAETERKFHFLWLSVKALECAQNKQQKQASQSELDRYYFWPMQYYCINASENKSFKMDLCGYKNKVNLF